MILQTAKKNCIPCCPLVSFKETVPWFIHVFKFRKHLWSIYLVPGTLLVLTQKLNKIWCLLLRNSQINKSYEWLNILNSVWQGAISNIYSVEFMRLAYMVIRRHGIRIKEIECKIITRNAPTWPNLDLKPHGNKRDFEMVSLLILSA